MNTPSLHVSSTDHWPSIIINKTLAADTPLLVVIIYTRNIINYNKVNFLLPAVYTDFMFYFMSHTDNS